MGIASTGYRIVFLLHILSAIIGFGAVMLNGVYGAEVKKRKGAEGLAIFRANERVSNIGQVFILLVPLWGVGLVFMSDGIWAFSQLWVWLSLVLYAAALTVSFGVVHPTAKRQGALLEELAGSGPPPGGSSGGPPPQVARLEANGKRLAAAGGVLHLALVAILVLMIWKPGL